MQAHSPLQQARTIGVAATIGVSLVASATVWAQGVKAAPPAPPADQKASAPARGSTLHFKTKLGSFKLLPKDPKFLPKGTLTMTFKGSLLISGIEGHGTIKPSGNIRREYYDPVHNKQVWYGKGGMVISGQMKNVEWFGDDLDATFTGDGFFRLMGEFAKDKTTGDYWFDDGVKWPWLPSGSNVAVPQERRTAPGYDEPPVGKPTKKSG